MSILDVKRRRDFRERRWQFAAVTVTIMLGVLTFAASYDAYLNLESSYQGTYDRLAFADMTVTGADDDFAAAARGIAGVAAVEDRRQVDVPLRVGNDVLEGRAIGMPAGTQPDIDRIDVIEGRYLDTSQPDGVIVETHVATDHDLGVGDTVEVFDGSRWLPLQVVGVAISPEYLWPAKSRQEVFTPPGTFGVVFVADRALAAVPSELAVDQTLIRYDGDADREATDARVRDAALAAGAADVQTRAQQPSNAALQLDVDGFQQLAVAFPALFLAAAGMAAFILLTRIVLSQRPQIGTLRASGVGRRRLTAHYLSYGVVLGGIGAVAGVGLGVMAGYWLSGMYTTQLGIPDTVRELHAVTVVVGIAFGVLTGLLAALVPARAALRMSPARAMRGEVRVDEGRRSLAERVIPALRHSPVRWRLVVRSIARDRRRSVSTVLGVVLALVLILASWGMIDTVVNLVHRQYDEVSLADASAVLAVPVDDAAIARVAAVEGVAHAEGVVTLDVSISANGDTYATQLRAFRRGTELHGFTNETGRLPDEGILVGAEMSDLLGVAAGDSVEVSFTGLDARATTTIDGFVDEPMGTMAYVERSVLERLLGDADPPVAPDVLTQPVIASVGSVLVDSANRTDVLADIGALDEVVTVVDRRALYELAQDLLGFFYVFVGMMLAFGGLMAFALIFNMISVNVAERSTEYATMRANGMPKRTIAWLIMGENLLLTVIGIVPGLIVGYLIAARFMGFYSSDMFQFDLDMRWSTFALAAVFMVVVAAISLWPGIRSVGRIDVASVVRERAI